MEPIFLFSQPRAGSTLLQKVLSAHSDIFTTAEPWMMLPLSEIWNGRATLSYYGHDTASSAIKEMFKTRRDSRHAHIGAARKYANHIYMEACYGDNPKYFLDKTPRYYWVIDDIAECFPDSKFIFLLRNPLSILFSMMNAWGGGSYRHMHAYVDDLLCAPKILASSIEKYGDRSIVVRYEEFVQNPRSQLNDVMSFLDVSYEDGMIENFVNVNIQGTLGDDVGDKKYRNILSNDSVDSWEQYNINPLRNYVSMKMLEKIGEEVLSQMGYEYDRLVFKLQGRKKLESSKLLEDIREIGFCIFKHYTAAAVWKKKIEYKKKYGFPLRLQ
jgi:hypothetical protein